MRVVYTNLRWDFWYKHYNTVSRLKQDMRSERGQESGLLCYNRSLSELDYSKETSINSFQHYISTKLPWTRLHLAKFSNILNIYTGTLTFNT